MGPHCTPPLAVFFYSESWRECHVGTTRITIKTAVRVTWHYSLHGGPVISLTGRLLVAVWVVPTPGLFQQCCASLPLCRGVCLGLSPGSPSSSCLPLVAVVPVFPALSFHDS